MSLSTVPSSPPHAGIAASRQFVIEDVSWGEYDALCKLWDGRKLRMSYDGRQLELMTTSNEHEWIKTHLGRLIETMSLELDIASSMTFKNERKGRGLEPDECYWIANEPRMRCRGHFDITTDPPPDLVIEIEVANAALPKMEIYAKLGFPEVWRFDGARLFVHRLQDEGVYAICPTSPSFPTVPVEELARWVRLRREMSENTWMRRFSAWIRDGMPVEPSHGS